ncbi:MAG TPA: hypothetical protein VJA19_05790 [Pseudomonas sp.]|nr:hypothetical protein [Pseudomonas sp.]
MSVIQFTVGIGLKAPIADGIYKVGPFSIEVSYPSVANLGMGPEVLPVGLSTVFSIIWEDVKGQDAKHLRAQSYHRHLTIHKALDAINELFQAYKLVRVGHIDSCGVRSIGIYDTLFYFSSVDGTSTGDLNVRWRGDRFQSHGASSHDPFGTTTLAAPHIATKTLPVARRYVRCYELLEHGFYSEAFIIAFSVMDDLVQEMQHSQLQLKGMSAKADRDSLLRGIKENRLKLYLGPLLKITAGSTATELWPQAEKALEWLNKIRNNIAHGGFGADYHSAAVGIYVCIKLLHTLHAANLMAAEFPVEFFRHAKLTAAWTLNPPAWVPVGGQAESMDFDS